MGRGAGGAAFTEPSSGGLVPKPLISQGGVEAAGVVAHWLNVDGTG